MMEAPVHRIAELSLSEISEWASQNTTTIYTVVSLVLNLCSMLAYNQLREECPLFTEAECIHFVLAKLPTWVAILAFNCLCALLQLFLFWSRRGHRSVTAFGVAQIVYLYLWGEQTISTTKYIGAANLLHLVVIAVALVVFFAGVGYFKLYQSYGKKVVYITLAALLVFWVYAQVQMAYSCD